MLVSGPVVDFSLLSTPSTVKLLLLGRWPPTEGPVPMPTPTPPALATPAVSMDRFSTPNPVLVVGKSSLDFAVYVFCTWAVVVSMTTVASLTLTVVVVLPTSNVKFAVATWFSTTETFFKVAGVKPAADADTSYCPGGRLPIRYSPDAFVCVDVFTFVALLVAVTLAPGTAAPVWSSTLPTRSPLIDWALALGEEMK